MKQFQYDDRPEIIGLQEYRRKPGNIHALQINEPFQVQTLEGLVTAKAGSYLVFGDKNDVWPVEEDIFNSRYELKPEYKEFQVKLKDALIGEMIHDVFDEYIGTKIQQPATIRQTDFDGWETVFDMDPETEVLVTRDIKDE